MDIKIVDSIKKDVETGKVAILEVHIAYIDTAINDLVYHGVTAMPVRIAHNVYVLASNKSVEITDELRECINNIIGTPEGRCEEYKTIQVDNSEYDIFVKYMDNIAVYDIYFSYIPE